GGKPSAPLRISERRSSWIPITLKRWIGWPACWRARGTPACATGPRPSGWQQPAVLETLAAAHAEAGQFEEAVKSIQGAIGLLNENGASNEARNLESRLQSFQTHQPCREDFAG